MLTMSNSGLPPDSPAPAGKSPTFIIIGVQKAGTTSIYNYLKEHPQVFMSPVKETDFFERDWTQEPAAVQAKKKFGIITFADYQRLFVDVSSEIAIGEASPNYLLHHQVSAERIRQYVPQAKLIAVLRNPIERAYSDYLMNVRDAIGKTHTPLGEQVKTRPESSFVLLKGKYYQPIKHFLEVFGPEQVKICLYDQLQQDAVAFMQDIYAFIGVDASFAPNVSRRAQTAQVPKNAALNRLMKTDNPLRHTVSSLLAALLPAAVRQRLRSQLIQLNSQDKKALPLSDTDRQLLKDYYREDIEQLQSLIQQDLSSWLR